MLETPNTAVVGL